MKLSTKEYIEKAKKVHGNKYQYHFVNFTRYKSNIKLVCTIHGIFSQRADVHLKSGCKKCGDDSKRFPQEKIIELSKKVHGDKYDYSKIIYKSYNENVEIICKIHGSFFQTPHNHISNKQDCGLCVGGITYNTSEFIRKCNIIHKNKYDYSKTKYIDSCLKVSIICPEHGEFNQLANSHTTGKGCLKCGNKYNFMENKWLDSLNINKEYRQQTIKSDKGHYRVDAFDPNTNTIYEFYGDFWHGNPAKYDSNDLNKRNKTTFGDLYKKTLYKEEKLKSLGYNLIVIWEDDYKKQFEKYDRT